MTDQISLAEAAALLHVSKSRVVHLCRFGQLTPTGTPRRLERAAVEDLARRRAVRQPHKE